MDCKVDMESIIKIESTMVGDDPCSPVKIERARRMRNCRSCKLMKKTYSNLYGRCDTLVKENQALETKNTELEEINGSLYLSLESVQREKEKMEQICKSSHSNSGSQVYEDKYFNMTVAYDKVVAENNSYKTKIQNLGEKLAEMQKQVKFKDEQLNTSRIRFSKMNQEYLTLKLKYGEDESFTEEHQSRRQERYSKATSEIIPSSYLKKISFPSPKAVTSDDLTLVCRLCTEKFPTRTSLRSHTGHCRKRSSEFPDLKSPSPSKSKVKRKSKSSSASKDTPKICHICDRMFTRPCNLGRHLKVHSASYTRSVKR